MEWDIKQNKKWELATILLTYQLDALHDSTVQDQVYNGLYHIKHSLSQHKKDVYSKTDENIVILIIFFPYINLTDLEIGSTTGTTLFNFFCFNYPVINFEGNFIS